MDECEEILTLSRKLERLLLGKEGMKAHFKSWPLITLPPGYSFSVLFPFNGACARFFVCKTDQPARAVSVFLDTRDILGYVEQPYWEASSINGDTKQFLLAETKELVDAIVAELERPAATSEQKHP